MLEKKLQCVSVCHILHACFWISKSVFLFFRSAFFLLNKRKRMGFFDDLWAKAVGSSEHINITGPSGVKTLILPVWVVE